MEQLENAETKKGAPRRDAALISLALLIAAGLIFSMLYSLGAGSTGDVVSRLVAAALTAGAATMIGGLLGFLFGIPRTFQMEEGNPPSRDRGAENGARSAYRPNTSLEQISDWLTKILVGVGLTQIASLQAHFASLGQGLGRAFGGRPIDEVFVTSLVAMLLVAGFLFGFLWTRIYLPGAFRAADLDALKGEVREELGRQADNDAELLQLVDQQLSSTPGQAAVPEDKLVAVLAKASANARLLVFEKAQEKRTKNWQNPATKPAMERCIPIFRALIRIGVESPIAHRYYGQLGYALKDQTTPDYKAAEEALTTAIRLRGPVAETGYVFYELNRAICRIMLDAAFGAGKASEPEAIPAILSDLKIAYQYGLDEVVHREDVTSKWIKLNKVSTASLAREG